MNVKSNHPLAEIIACKLFGISTVPREEGHKMVNRAVKAAIEYHEAQIRHIVEPINDHFTYKDDCYYCNKMAPAINEVLKRANISTKLVGGND